jgi:hypothetical protein
MAAYHAENPSSMAGMRRVEDEYVKPAGRWVGCRSLLSRLFHPLRRLGESMLEWRLAGRSDGGRRGGVNGAPPLGCRGCHTAGRRL